MNQFTQRMRGRKIAGMRKEAMRSLTKREAVFLGYKAIPFKGHLSVEEMQNIAEHERHHPDEWWRYLARVQAILVESGDSKLTQEERDLVKFARTKKKNPSSAAAAICAKRRLGI